MTTRIVTLIIGAILASQVTNTAFGQAAMNGLTYRAGDPFVFCTQGQGWDNAPEQCWIPMPPYTGNFMMMAYCDPPNTYGKTWSQDDYNSLSQYLTICPQALSPGAWTGETQPENVPFKH